MRSLLSSTLSAALVTPVAMAITLNPSAAQVSIAKNKISGSRSSNILANIPGLIPYPTSPPGTSANGTPRIAFENIQADILAGMQKNKQSFLFFSINNATSFKAKLRTSVSVMLTSARQLMSVRTQPRVALNIAFSQSGLHALGVNDDLGDAAFSAGQFADAEFLGDPGTDNWKPAFKGTSVHGVFLFASDSTYFTDAMGDFLRGTFSSDINEEYRLDAAVRPGDQAGHEPFGFLDGIAQPGIAQFQAPFPGQQVVDPGVILLNETGDTIARPAWAKDGSFLAFRELQQLVPEFHAFLNQSAPAVNTLTHAESADLLGARLIGRWKSGAPVDNFPLKDPGPSVGKNALINNNFNYSHPGFDITIDQSHCPFSAHIRKTRPRADLVAPANSIMRSGIPYGPEVTDAENYSGQSDSSKERGLAFVAYQAQIAKGFRFLQHSWANNPKFVFGKNVSPGFDPIIGANAGQPRTVEGVNVADTTQSVTLPTDWIISRGGEYFFSPSISAVKTVLTSTS